MTLLPGTTFLHINGATENTNATYNGVKPGIESASSCRRESAVTTYQHCANTVSSCTNRAPYEGRLLKGSANPVSSSVNTAPTMLLVKEHYLRGTKTKCSTLLSQQIGENGPRIIDDENRWGDNQPRGGGSEGKV